MKLRLNYKLTCLISDFNSKSSYSFVYPAQSNIVFTAEAFWFQIMKLILQRFFLHLTFSWNIKICKIFKIQLSKYLKCHFYSVLKIVSFISEENLNAYEKKIKKWVG